MRVRFSVGVLGLIVAFHVGEPSAQAPTLRVAMREKLTNTQQLLEAVVRADYPAMARYSEQLSRISYTEIASWQTVAQPEYVRYATQFLTSVKDISDAAGRRNGDEAARVYTTLIGSCVGCHTYVRNSKVASMAPSEPPREAAIPWARAIAKAGFQERRKFPSAPPG